MIEPTDVELGRVPLDDDPEPPVPGTPPHDRWLARQAENAAERERLLERIRTDRHAIRQRLEAAGARTTTSRRNPAA